MGVQRVGAAAGLRLGIAGFGNVGRAFAEMLLERRSALAELLGAEPVPVFIADSRGMVCQRRGLAWGLVEEALRAPRGGVSRLEGGRPGASVEEALEECEVDVLVDATPSVYEDPVQLRWWLRVLRSGGAVVTADKAPLATRCGMLRRFIHAEPRLFYKATVMAGSPLVDLLRWGFAGRRVSRLTGVLNGTTNYLLNRAAEGAGFQEALREAQERGYAEPDPSADLRGLDLAAKAVIAACSLGSEASIDRVEVRAVVDEEAFERARRVAARGARLRYVAIVEPRSGRLAVDLVEAEPGSPLHDLPGVMNAALVENAEAEPVLLRGPGAGPLATAAALLSDLVEAAALLGVARGG